MVEYVKFEKLENIIKQFIVIVFILLLSGCSSNTTISDVVNNVVGKNNSDNLNNFNNAIDDFGIAINNINNQQTTASINTIENNNGSLLIASWNVQNFGESKARDNRLYEIAYKIDDFDIIAVQEVSNINEMKDNSCSRNVNAQYNKNYMLIQNKLKQTMKGNYGFVMSPQIYDERYMFIINNDKVKLNSCWVSKDSNSGQLCEKSSTGLMVRESWNCEFEFNNKKFVIMTAHTSPTINFQELQGLKIFFDLEKEKENDVILLGDLNLDCNYIKNGNPFNNYDIIDFGDTTVNENTNCGYDVVITNELDEIQIINNGVDRNITKDISDHYLVWVEIE